jgi:hypothetical protein
MTDLLNINTNKLYTDIISDDNIFRNNMRLNDNNINISSIKLDNISINNTLEINYTHDTKRLNDKNNGCIRLLDRNDSIFKDIFLLDNDLYIIPRRFENNKFMLNEPIKLLREDDLDIIINSNNIPFIFNDVKISDIEGSIRFINSNNSETLDKTLIGFRQYNGNIEYRNESYDDWISLESSLKSFDFYDLHNINMNKDLVLSGNYIKLDNNKKLINMALTINDDKTPILGGNLNLNHNNIIFDTEGGILDKYGNLTLKIDTQYSNNNFINIKKSNDDNLIELYIDNLDDEYSNLKISTKKGGDMEINLIHSTNNNNVSSSKDKNLITRGDLIIKANELNLSDISSFNMSSGKFITSVDYLILSNNNVGIIEDNARLVNISSESLILINNDKDMNYFIYLKSGENGQKINIIYESYELNTSVTILFKDENENKCNVGLGSYLGGLCDKLYFNSSGQSITLQYLKIYPSDSEYSSRNRWQVLNCNYTLL